jgi:uncharacterized membrane protein HdeD (DUF308 family)
MLALAVDIGSFLPGRRWRIAIEHRRQFSGRWAWMAISGVIDIFLASILLFDIPGSSAWTLGLLVGTNMMFGGAALLAMGLHARSSAASS